MPHKQLTYPHVQSENIGILLRILSGIAFTIMGVLIKYIAESVPLGQVIFFRSSFAIFPLIVFLIWQRQFPSALKTANIIGHLWRCSFGLIAMFGTFATLRYLPIAEATTLGYLSPIILVILATFFLKETISPRRWWGVILGLQGLLLMTAPNFSSEINIHSLTGIGLGICSAIFIAAALLQVRKLTLSGEKIGTITIYFALCSTVISAFTALLGWVSPSTEQWIMLISIGFIGGIGQLLMTLSFSYASASALATYEYLAILWAIIAGYVFFNELPSIYFWFAVPLILAGAIIAKPRKFNKQDPNNHKQHRHTK
ncbi:MAG: DMT family transporter [Gammaproteobacteria bacterium]|nr:DMT family transporter [Gammaproteobacteria bacterium]